MLADASHGEHGGTDYDATYEERARALMWLGQRFRPRSANTARAWPSRRAAVAR